MQMVFLHKRNRIIPGDRPIRKTEEKMREFSHVSGKNSGKIILFALSTCSWCRKTKKLLDGLGVEYDYIDMDLVDRNAVEQFRKEHEKWNPQCNFPTLVINNKKCIVGFDEDTIREALE
jgi:glutaredoxin-like protein NrdH